MGLKISHMQLTIGSFPKFHREAFLQMTELPTHLMGLIVVSYFSIVWSLAAEETANLPPSPPPSPASERTVAVEAGKASWTF